MSLEWCTGCFNNLVDPEDTLYCSDGCREKAHRRYVGLPARETRRRITPETLPIAAAWRALADEANKISPPERR